MTKIIGLTGGIGSGKTTIANYFKSLGIPVYIADDEAKKIMQLPEIIDSLKETFGQEIFENNILSTEKLAKIVFNNPEKLKLLNNIVHPAVKKHFDQWLLSYKNVPFVIKEAAILFESGSYKYCDKIITVISPMEERIRRVMVRDKTSRENVLNRIYNQWTDEQRIAKSDYVIHNITVKEAQLQVHNILNLLKNI
jgi:dephospho-CoA kinase